jgi:hypothetical protein
MYSHKPAATHCAAFSHSRARLAWHRETLNHLWCLGRGLSPGLHTFRFIALASLAVQMAPAAQKGACSSKRSCATAYPTKVEGGLLYVWLDSSPEGLAESKTGGVMRSPGDESASWNMSNFPGKRYCPHTVLSAGTGI